MKLIERITTMMIQSCISLKTNIDTSLDGILTETVAYKPEISRFSNGSHSMKAIGKSKPVIDDKHLLQECIGYDKCLDDNYIRSSWMMSNDNISKNQSIERQIRLHGIHPIRQVQTTRFSKYLIFQLVHLINIFRIESVYIKLTFLLNDSIILNIGDNSIGYPLTIYSYVFLCPLSTEVNPYAVFSKGIFSQSNVRLGC